VELLVDNQASPVGPASPGRSGTSFRRAFLLAGAGVVLCLLVYYAPHFLLKEETPPRHVTLKTGGTSVVAVMVQNRWKTAFRQERGIDVVYESSGSSGGVGHLIDNDYAIAFTHGPLSDEQRQRARAKGGDLLQIPVLLCGVAPVYNLKELKDKAPLRVTGAVLADIFLGKITTWDDPALKELNPGADLPPTRITVVHRDDPSGTTELFTDYLAAESPAWREQVGPPGATARWPVGVGATRSLGVALKVDATPGAIGYVDRLYTSYEDIDLSYAAVQNKDRTGFVRAEPENMTAAVKGSLGQIPDDLGFRLADRSGNDSYPISGVIYAVCYQNQSGAAGKAVPDFLRWVVHDGQQFANKSRYAALPPELVERVDQKINSIKAGS
jgi:phosphate transport system substrate-binding protein